MVSRLVREAADVKPEEQLLLDGDALAHGKAFFRLGATRHSPDHRLLAAHTMGSS